MLIYEDRDFKILKSKRDSVLIRKGLEYKNHSHFRRRDGCYTLMSLYRRKLIPKRRYYREAMQRITTEEEYLNFTQKANKSKYYNATGRGKI